MSHLGKALFCYGTLRDEPLLRALLGREARRCALRLLPAVAPGRRAAAHRSGAYPVLAVEPGGRLEGDLVLGLTAPALERLIAYEGAEYRLGEIEVHSEAAPEIGTALAFEPIAPPPPGARGWRFEDWLEEEVALRRTAAATLGALFDAEAARSGGRPETAALAALTELWPDCLGAEARRLGAAGPIERALGRGLGREAVEELTRERAYEAFFKVDDLVLRHRMFESPDRLGEAVERAVFRMGQAVCVLPYDPVSDRVLMIEQFRAGQWVAGDARPWSIEVVAGRIEAAAGRHGDAEEATARAEAAEEAGLTLGRLERFNFGYASPGATDEAVTFFVGEARLPAPEGGGGGGLALGGVHGLAEEGEDIRVLTLGLDAALEAQAAGEIRNLPAALALLWLARNRPRLQALWSAPGPLDQV